MSDSDKPTIIKVPEHAHDLVRKLYEDIKSLSKERTDIIMRYMAERQAVEEKFAPLSAELIGRINQTKLQGSAALCEACGIPYDPESGYAVDAQYLEFGVAFLNVLKRREDGLRFDGDSHDLPAPGTRLN